MHVRRRNGTASSPAGKRRMRWTGTMGRWTTAVALVLLPVATAAAQEGGRGVEAGGCYGFSFGTWTPPLDWRGAGHEPLGDDVKVPKAPAGRDWAAQSAGTGGEILLLYPSWWLAGVSIQFATGAPAPGDTVRATATALVADGKSRSPTAQVRVWRVPCRAPNEPPDGG